MAPSLYYVRTATSAWLDRPQRPAGGAAARRATRAPAGGARRMHAAPAAAPPSLPGWCTYQATHQRQQLTTQQSSCFWKWDGGSRPRRRVGLNTRAHTFCPATSGSHQWLMFAQVGCMLTGGPLTANMAHCRRERSLGMHRWRCAAGRRRLDVAGSSPLHAPAWQCPPRYVLSSTCDQPVCTR